MRIESVLKGASGSATIAAGGSSFLIDLSLAEGLGLEPCRLVPGAELDETEAGLLALAAEAREAEKRGLALLARAEQSTFMLRGKLEIRGFSHRAVGIALERLSVSRFLDDRRFASAYAASRLARGGSKAEGPASLIAALRERGIDRTIAAEVIAELLGPEERSQALAKATAKALKRSGGDRDAARIRLRELGYKSEEIREYFDSLNGN
jgi:SOS response regulatory protein OraA/RecX